MRKKVRNAGPVSRLRTSASGGTRNSPAGDGAAGRLSGISISGDDTLNMEKREGPAGVAVRSAVEAREGFGTEPAVAEEGAAGPDDERLARVMALQCCRGQARRGNTAADAKSRLLGPRRLDLNELMLQSHRRRRRVAGRPERD